MEIYHRQLPKMKFDTCCGAVRQAESREKPQNELCNFLHQRAIACKVPPARPVYMLSSRYKSSDRHDQASHIPSQIGVRYMQSNWRTPCHFERPTRCGSCWTSKIARVMTQTQERTRDWTFHKPSRLWLQPVTEASYTESPKFWVQTRLGLFDCSSCEHASIFVAWDDASPN